MEKIEFEERKNILKKYAKRAGFKNLKQLSDKAGIPESNIYSNLNGRFGMSIKRMLKIATLLGCPIENMVELFYPEEYGLNKKAVMMNIL